MTALGGETMGTSWTVRASLPDGVDAVHADAAIETVLAQMIAELSHWQPDSAISRFNRSPQGMWLAMAPALDRVLAAALDIAHASSGAFDPAIGRLSSAWGFGPEGPRAAPPEAALIATIIAGRGWRAIERRGQFARRTGDVTLDFSGIGKGHAVDAVVEALVQIGIRHALVEIGGELRGIGIRPDAQPWWVDVETPAGIATPPLRVGLHDLSIATSGDYRRWFAHGGLRYAHSIDPRTGAPVTNGVASVTVLHPECMLADAWATALTVLGPQAGMALAEKRGLAVRMLVRDPELREILSPALEEMCS